MSTISVGVVFIPLIVLCFLCEVGALWIIIIGGRSSPPRDQHPPRLTCPADIHTVADPIQVSAKIWWKEPRAYDNELGTYVTAWRSGLPPGKLFSEGIHQISYSARDYSGNTAFCSFSIHVKVIRCHRWSTPSDGWKICYPSDGMRLGGVCRFGCYPGHDHVGAPRATCQMSGAWTISNRPYCKKKTCGPLFPSSEQMSVMSIQCTDGVNYRSKCYYVCRPGYSVRPGHSKVVVCGVQGTWVGTTPICIDSQPPEFRSCPVVKTVYADRNLTSGRAFWVAPVARDNSGHVTTEKTLGPSIGDKLGVGEYDVTYTAIDSAGNKASCQFKLIIKQILCAEIFPLPYTSVTCPDGRIYGASCHFKCDNGTASRSSLETICDKGNGAKHNYGLWDFGNYQPYCEQTNNCPTLQPPGNGALACDTWYKGEFCHVMCEKNYWLDELPKPSGANMLVCGETYGWHGYNGNIPDIPDCSKMSNRDSARYGARIQYWFLSGQCEDAKDEIRTDFIKSYTSNKLGFKCNPSQCSVQNVKVMCGKRVKRGAGTSTALTIMMSVTIQGDQSVADIFAKYEDLKNTLAGANVTVNGQTMLPGQVDVETPTAKCAKGCVPSNTVALQCVECGPGSYQDTTVEPNVCRKCDIGWFQQKVGQTACQACPSGMTTEKMGASECKKACRRGQYSPKGTPPCSPCDIGKFSGVEGTRECLMCPGSKTTNTAGSTSQDACFDFDVSMSGMPGNDDDEFVAPSVSTNMTSSSEFGLSMWLRCDACAEVLTITNDTGGVFLTVTITDGDTLETTIGSTSLPAAKVVMPSDTWHYLYVAWSPQSVALYLDGELVSSGSNSLTLPQKLNVYFGGPGFVGSASQLNMISSIRPGDESRGATCFSAYIGDLVSWRQYAHLDGSFTQIRSKCDAFDNCRSSPCQNGGNCSDDNGGFTCACVDGYSGSECSVDIDDCEDSTCDNGGTCVDGVNSYSCDCPHGFDGELCEIQVVDGAWGEFGNWSLCSVTCGTGQQVRNRTCDNPEPSNGGKNCTGLSFETKECEMDVCVNECDKDPEPIEHGNLNCKWENGTRRCYPVCDEGYDFDDVLYIDPPNIICGPETYNMWNIKSPDNLKGQLSQCREKIKGKKNTVTFNATYGELHAMDDITKSHIQTAVRERASQTDCALKGRCDVVDVEVHLIQESDSRRKRSISSVTFSLLISCDIYTDINECYDLLKSMLTELNNMVSSQGYTVIVGDVGYDVTVNSSAVGGTTVCDPGSIPVFHYCIPCGQGMYEHGYFCERCAVGFYQDQVGQQTCKQCPEGWTTEGLQTRSASFCNVAASVKESETSIVVIVCTVVTGVAVLGLLGVTVAYYKLKTRPMPNSVASSMSRLDWNNDRTGDVSCNTKFKPQNRSHTPYHLFTVAPSMSLYESGKKNAPLGAEAADVDAGPLPSKDDHARSSSGIGQYDNPLYDDNE